jgi:hypothetical protein
MVCSWNCGSALALSISNPIEKNEWRFMGAILHQRIPLGNTTLAAGRCGVWQRSIQMNLPSSLCFFVQCDESANERWERESYGWTNYFSNGKGH